MPFWLLVLFFLLGAYLLLVLALVLLGRREQARALAGFVPDCALLFSRLVRDPCVSRGRRVILVALAAYLASPIDLIPDFIPAAGHADDVVVVALALRIVLAACPPETLREHWPGPESSLRVVTRLAGARD